MKALSTDARAIARAVVSACVLTAAVACGPKLRPIPDPKPPAPAPVIPIVVDAPVVSWTMPAVVPMARYISEVATTLQRDSAGRVLQEHVDTRGVISLQGRRDTTGSFRGSGVVDSFTVRGLESVLAPNSGETTPGRTVPVIPDAPLRVMFDAQLDSRVLIITTRPPLATECDQAARGATNMVRDVIVRLPKTLSVGTAWQDSTNAIMCRLGIPITSRSKSSYVVERADKVQGGIELVVRKTTDSQLTGELRSTWRTMTLNASGRNVQIIRVDGTSGLLRTVESDGLLTVKLTDSSRRDGSGTQEIKQTTKGRVTLRP